MDVMSRIGGVMMQIEESKDALAGLVKMCIQ
jgi:hypothetical protein